jgi:hypothetical protein
MAITTVPCLHRVKHTVLHQVHIVDSGTAAVTFYHTVTVLTSPNFARTFKGTRARSKSNNREDDRRSLNRTHYVRNNSFHVPYDHEFTK